MPKSRDVASRASTSIAAKESGISLGCSMQWHRINLELAQLLMLTWAVWRLEPLG